jgi:hypothetical protein
MKLTLLKKPKIITSSVIILIILIASVTFLILKFNFKEEKSSTSKDDSSPFEKALKFDGEYIDSEYFEKEYLTFYNKYKTNAEVIKKTDEERNDLFYQEVIEKLILEKYVDEKSPEIEEETLNHFIEKYVKSKFETDEDFEYYLSESGFENENELKDTSLIYLKEVNVLPDIAKKYGIELTKEEKSSTDKTESMLITEKFLDSENLSEWIKTIENNYPYEILEPSTKAYRFVLEENYLEASKYYLEAYEKYGDTIYKEKAEVYENKN